MRIARSSPREPPRARRASSSPATWTRPSSLEPSTSERAQAAPPPLPTDASRPWSRRRCPWRVAPPPSSFVATFGEPATHARRPRGGHRHAVSPRSTRRRRRGRSRTQHELVHVLAIRRRGARAPTTSPSSTSPRWIVWSRNANSRITKTTRRGRNLPGFEPGARSESARGTTTPRGSGEVETLVGSDFLARRRRGEDGRVGVFRVSARAAEDARGCDANVHRGGARDVIVGGVDGARGDDRRGEKRGASPVRLPRARSDGAVVPRGGET